MNVPLKDADRIAGGMTRIEHEYKNWSDLITQALKLAENVEQERPVWYLIGFRSGVLCDRTIRDIFPIPKRERDPSIQ